ncbi:nicotinamide N-methylase [Acidocella aquatica]|uniref:Nicotinamide N-methylase n=1 Tax=Acidocella aquatica TaxID=1922313 RepID=A0ABQ6A1Q9_9PROT|nr:50S ribosomal protein L11 methyltransferase [Acidocella aquatica]GLR65543.1 nicotinamide N-methylase [Acidocella aquatica]
MPEFGGRGFAGFIRANTALGASRLVPGIKIYLACEITPLWQASEEFLQHHGMAPPFWAFAWPGSEALARHITDHPELVRGLRVLDFAAGCGLAALAARRAGAAQVDAAEIDPLAGAAISLNAAENGLAVNVLQGDIVGADCRWDVILCGDVCYEAPMTRHILPWLRRCAAAAVVVIADPGRKYAPDEGELLARYEVPTSLALEDSCSRQVKLFRLLATP